MRFTRRTLLIVSALLIALVAVEPARAQDGVGSTGAQVLQLVAGARAASLSGAYTAAWTDSDVLFYNPAGTAALGAAASLAYQRHTAQGITFGSASGVYEIAGFAVGAGVAFLDAGEVAVIVPDPDFGGERGEETGETASAGESAVRLSAGKRLLDGRFRVGAAAGFVSSALADVTRGSVIFDAGAQYDAMPNVAVGASLRNLGPRLSGEEEDVGGAPLPSEARFGATAQFYGADGMGAVVAADVISRLNEGTTSLVAGIEAGLMPTDADRLSAVARAGYDLDDLDDEDGPLGAFRLGAGISLGSIAVDYTFRQFEYFGAVHRFGLRWRRGTP